MLMTLLFICASSALMAKAEAPPYYASENNIKEFVKIITDVIEFSDGQATETQKNYLAILLTANLAGQQLNLGIDYNIAYQQKLIAIPLARSSPETIRDQLNKEFSSRYMKMAPLTDILDKCIVNHSSSDCDEQVDAEVQRNPDYQPIATLLLEYGRLGELFNPPDVSGNILTASEEDRIEEYLVDNEEFLKPVFYQEAKVLKADNAVPDPTT